MRLPVFAKYIDLKKDQIIIPYSDELADYYKTQSPPIYKFNRFEGPGRPAKFYFYMRPTDSDFVWPKSHNFYWYGKNRLVKDAARYPGYTQEELNIAVEIEDCLAELIRDLGFKSTINFPFAITQGIGDFAEGIIVSFNISDINEYVRTRDQKLVPSFLRPKTI